MSWLKENKFAAGIAGATIVGSAALLTLTSQKSGEYDDNASKLKKALQEEATLQGATPYPNADNLEKKKKAVADFAESADALKGSFDGYRPSSDDLADVSAMEFSKMVGDYESRLNAKFEELEVEVPESVKYGFDAYASKLPKDEATGELTYQMKALEWMLVTLADNEPDALLNVVRPKLAIEQDAPKEVVSKSKKKKKKSKKKSKKARKSKSGPKGEPVFSAMPVELAFRCSEEQLKAYLEDLVNSDEYFFSVRAMRIQNERLTPPNNDDVSFASAEKDSSDDASGFGGFVIEEEAEEEEVVEALVASDSDKTKALAQILGAEKLNVFLKLDLLVFDPSEDSGTEKNN